MTDTIDIPDPNLPRTAPAPAARPKIIQFPLNEDKSKNIFILASAIQVVAPDYESPTHTYIYCAGQVEAFYVMETWENVMAVWQNLIAEPLHQSRGNILVPQHLAGRA